MRLFVCKLRLFFVVAFSCSRATKLCELVCSTAKDGVQKFKVTRCLVGDFYLCCFISTKDAVLLRMYMIFICRFALLVFRRFYFLFNFFTKTSPSWCKQTYLEILSIPVCHFRPPTPHKTAGRSLFVCKCQLFHDQVVWLCLTTRLRLPVAL